MESSSKRGRKWWRKLLPASKSALEWRHDAVTTQLHSVDARLASVDAQLNSVDSHLDLIWRTLNARNTASSGGITQEHQKQIFDNGASTQERYRRAAVEYGSAAKDQYCAIAMRGHGFNSPVGDLVTKSFVRAMAGDSKLPADVRDIDGMSGQIYRSFINNLVGDHPNPNYMEIGCWAGSTATAALYGNKARCLCIDNWSLFGGPKETFFSNIESIRSDDIDFKFLESDFRSVDYSAIGSFNIYMFDGPHDQVDQYDGIKLVQPALEDIYVLIVDDWNWQGVRDGTLQALIDTKSIIRSSIEVRTSSDNSHPEIDGKKSDWHNGYFIATIQKG